METTNYGNILFNKLPASILSTIFVLAQNPNISLLNKNMHYASQQVDTISKYIIKYVLSETGASFQLRLKNIFENYTRISMNETVGALVLRKAKNLDFRFVLKLAFNYKWRNMLNKLLKMYVVIDRNTSTVVYKGTVFMNNSEHLDINTSGLFSKENEPERELVDIRVSESLFIRPLIVTERVLRLIMAKVANAFQKEDVEALIDVCNSKIEIPPELTGCVGVDVGFINSKAIIYYPLSIIQRCCKLNNLELLKRVLSLKINTNFPYQDLKSHEREFNVLTSRIPTHFIEDYGYESNMEFLAYLTCSYYSICWDRNELIKFLEDNCPDTTCLQILFDVAIHHRKDELVKKYLFSVELNSVNIRKITGLAFRKGNVDLIRVLLDFSDKLKGDLDDSALKTAIKKKEYKLAQEIISKYPSTVSISCLEKAVKKGDITIALLIIEAGVDIKTTEFKGIRIASENKDMDMIRLLLENGASVELVDQFVIENLLGIMNCEIADRLLELFDKDEGSYHVHDKVTNGTKVRFNKTMMCLIEVCHAYHQTIFGSNVEFDEFHKHLDLYEKVMVIANSKRKNIAEAFDKSYRSFHVLSRGYEKYVADFYNFYEILVYVILNDLEVTFNDTEYYRSNEFKNEKSIKIFKGTPYELAKSELVNRNFENIKLLIDYGININCGNSLILRTAYKAGEIGWINYFITKGAKLEGESNGFEEACKSNKTDVLEHWIRSGGVVPKNPEYPCINMACLLGNFDMIKLLVENGVDLSDPKRNGVRIACRLGFNKKLEYLLEHNAVLGRVCRYQLEYVCLVEDIESVKMILDHYDGLGVLEKRENMDRKDRKIKNDSFLSHEITGNSDRYKITKALLERGESIQNDDLIDGIKAAVAASNIEILKLLLAYKINHSNGSEIMEAAVQSENIEVIKLLLKNGLSVYGNTKILNVAFMTKNTENIRFLLENGAKISGDSLYLKHVDLDDIETLQLILNYCPDVCGTSFLLQAAIDKNNLEAVKLLLKNTVSLKNNEYNYVLWACRINNLEILKMLFAKGAKIRDGCESGVMQACESNNLEMLMLLFERSPNLVLNRDFGIKQAVRHKNLEMIKLLIKHGANLDSYVKSIMRIAIDTNDHKLIKFCQCRMLVVDKKLTSF